MRADGRLITLALLFPLAACQAPAPNPRLGIDTGVPADYRARIVEVVRLGVNDPYSLRSAEITAPTRIFVGLLNGGYVPGVCFRMNGRNKYGAYGGVRTFAVAFQNGDVSLAAPPVFNSCAEETWSPFPELEAIT